MGKSGCRCRVGKVIRGHVYRLDRGDGTIAGGSDPLLHKAHLRRQGRLITYGRWHPAEQGRNLRPRLGEPEDVVYKEQDIAALTLAVAIPVIFCDSKSAEGDPRAGAGRFIHLTEYKSS